MKLYGIGTDIIELARIARLLQNPRFLPRCFTAEEQAYFARFENKTERVAGHFCAKEALFKALGTGLEGHTFLDIAVAHTAKGQPYFAASGAMGAFLQQEGLMLQLSISHSDSMAVAFVVASRQEVAK